jgi:hypothetical protein
MRLQNAYLLNLEEGVGYIPKNVSVDKIENLVF